MSRAKPLKLYRPGPDGWEAWTFLDGSQPNVEPIPAQNGPPTPAARSIVALPARAVNVLPLWLNADDPALIPEMAEIQIASGGLSRKAAPVVRTISTEKGRSFVAAMCLPFDPPESLCDPKVGEFLASPEIEDLPEDGVAVWAEGDHRVIAITRAKVPVYWESRKMPCMEELLSDLSCLVVRLAGEGFIERLAKIVLRLPTPPELRLELARRFGAEVVEELRPPPRLPAKEAGRLLPGPVVRKREAARRRKAMAVVSMCAALFIIVAAAVLVGRQQLLASENARLQRALDAEAPIVQQVSAAQSRWASLRPALDPDLYPVERLLQAALLMPTDGLRLTVYEQSLEEGVMRVILIGEASSPQAAFAFTEAVRTHPAWTMFQWQIPQPTILPNNAARFRMEGSFSYATSF